MPIEEFCEFLKNNNFENLLKFNFKSRNISVEKILQLEESLKSWNALKITFIVHIALYKDTLNEIIKTIDKLIFVKTQCKNEVILQKIDIYISKAFKEHLTNIFSSLIYMSFPDSCSSKTMYYETIDLLLNLYNMADSALMDDITLKFLPHAIQETNYLLKACPYSLENNKYLNISKVCEDNKMNTLKGILADMLKLVEESGVNMVDYNPPSWLSNNIQSLLESKNQCNGKDSQCVTANLNEDKPKPNSLNNGIECISLIPKPKLIPSNENMFSNETAQLNTAQFEENSGNTDMKGDNYSRMTLNVNSIQIVPSILEISNKEFDSIPGYMRGRLKCADLNEFIAKMNLTFTKKCGFYHKNKKFDALRKLSPELQTLFHDYKLALKSMGASANHFITQKDIWTFAQTKMDKRSYQYFVILRHLQKIREVRRGSEIMYHAC